MNITLIIFIGLLIFCIYILFGLHVTEGLETLTQQILGWVVYTILWVTVLIIFTLGYFWSIIRKKTGPYGIRGPPGETGKIGLKGACNINASTLYCMKTLNDYINYLYKEKTNTNILNVEKQKFPCNYLNEKIQTLANSRQYNVVIANLSSDNKGINNLINYLKSIWKIWFELIYNSTSVPGIWFTDTFGDENYEWSGNNPFDEIKKYDIYYWGITRDFRPLKAELCRSNSANGLNSKFPKHQLSQSQDTQVRRLKIIKTNNYKYIGSTYTHDDNQDGSWWTPHVQTVRGDKYYPVGDIMVIGDNNPTKTGKTIVSDASHNSDGNDGPDMSTILVAGDVVDPIGYKTASGLYTHDKVRIKSPICPDGYTAIGDASTSNRVQQKLNEFKCLPTECVEEIAPGPLHQEIEDDPHQWNRYNKWFNWDKFLPGYSYTWYNNVNVLNSWDSDSPDPDYTNGYNLMRGSESEREGQQGNPWYRIKRSCLVSVPNRDFPPLPNIPPPSTREVEEGHAELGIGWYGHPYKLDPKYSIFSFLNLVPEGMIVNQGTGQRFYIIHNEGRDINIFNILTYNNNSGKFDGSLQINLNNIVDPNDKTIPNNKNYPDISNLGNLVNPSEPIPQPVEFNPPNKRIIIVNLDPTNITQQWKIILGYDKKLFKIKSLYDNTYIIVTQESREGLVEFSSISIDNNAYKNDPAFSNIEQDELDNRTNFSFISSFGTQLDIIERDDNNTTNQ